MTASSKRNPSLYAFAAACVLLFALFAWTYWAYGMLKLRVAFAEGQTRIFDDMRSKALTNAPAEAIECLQYLVAYYPSGSKQVLGSHLDRIVERDRALAVRDIIANLRARGGRDFGEKPEDWINGLKTSSGK